MKKYRSRVGQRIYPVEYSSMTGILFPMSLIPLSLLMAEMTTSPENPAIATRALTRITFGSGEGSQETEEVTNDGSTDYTAQKSFPRFCSDLLSGVSYVVREVCPR